MPDFLYDWALLLHVIGAVGLGYYLIFPLIFSKTRKLSGDSLASYLSGAYSVSRVMQYLLIAQLLTGGYIMGGNYTPFWMAVSIGLLVFIGAISGVMNGKLKKAVKALQGGSNAEGFLASVNWMSWVVTISLLVILYVMMNPQYG